MQKLSIFICTKIISNEHLEMLELSCQYLSKIYPNVPVYIINDNSPMPILRSNLIGNDINIIDNEYPGSGEFARLYYFYKLHPTEYAICIHDNQFINKKIPLPEKYTFLFSAGHGYDDTYGEISLLKTLENTELLKYYRNHKHGNNSWAVAFGVQCIVKYSFLLDVVQIFPKFFDIVKYIKTRKNRMACERIVPCVFNYVSYNPNYVYGEIHDFTDNISNGKTSWGLTMKEFKKDIDIYSSKPSIKLWAGR